MLDALLLAELRGETFDAIKRRGTHVTNQHSHSPGLNSQASLANRLSSPNAC